jgi:hypothetical protein
MRTNDYDKGLCINRANMFYEDGVLRPFFPRALGVQRKRGQSPGTGGYDQRFCIYSYYTLYPQNGKQIQAANPCNAADNAA